MIEALKGEAIVQKAGGRFKLTALIQHRLRELLDGARPLVERRGRSDMEIVIQEIAENKITLEMTEDDASGPKPKAKVVVEEDADE